MPANEMKTETFYTVAIDETDGWDTETLAEHGIRAAFGLYLVRGGEITHVCSLTGSSWAINLRNEFVFNGDVSRNKREYAEDELCNEGLVDTYIAYVDPDKYDARFITDAFEIEQIEVPRNCNNYRDDLWQYVQDDWDPCNDAPRITWGDRVFEEWDADQATARRAENRPVSAYPYLPLFSEMPV